MKTLIACSLALGLFFGLGEACIWAPSTQLQVHPGPPEAPVPFASREKARIARTILTTRPEYDRAWVREIATTYLEAGEHFGIDPMILVSKDWVESRFDPRAVSRDRQGNPLAHGWAQFIESTGRHVWEAMGWEYRGVEDLYDPHKSIWAGAHYLRYLLDRYQGNLQYALTAYNMGPTAFDRLIRNVAFSPRFTYAQAVLSRR